MIPKPQRDDKGRVQGEFYPLQKAELVALRKAKLINNAAFVHLALRYENPFCDHPIILIPKEFALRWQIPESSVYEAIAKLKENHAITIRSGKVTIEWANSDDSQQASDSENPEKFWNPRKNSGIPEKILESQKKFRNPRKNSENSEKRASKPAQGKNSKALQTIQSIQTFTDSLSETEREKFLEFGLKKASELPKPPALPEKWIERNFKELHVQFRKEVSEAILPSQEWEHHPHRDDWLLEIRTKGAGAFVGLAPQQERSERVKFREWAQANYQI